MQAVSAAWKANQNETFVSESFVEISYEISDPAAKADASATDNGCVTYSNVAQTVKEIEKKPIKYATLENDLWALDGTFEMIPNAPPYGDQGYIGSELSGQDGTFNTPPTITISFRSVHPLLIPGVTITWASAYGEFADTVKVTAFQDTVVRSEKTVSGNKLMQTIVSIDIQNYNKITIEILKWCKPYRRARIETILVGMKKIYTKDDLIHYEHSMNVDPLSATLPKVEVTFEVSNVDGSYNPDNPNGAERYIMERQEVKVRYGYQLGGAVEWIMGGTLYTGGWETPQNGITATFTARDLIEFMNERYTGANTGSLYEIAERALTQAKLPLNSNGTTKWALDESLRTVPAPSGADLHENTIAEILQLVANAGCCLFYQDRAGTLHIKPYIVVLPDYRIGPNNSYENAEIILSKQLKTVDVNQGAYVLTVSQSGEMQPVRNMLISAERAPVVAAWVAGVLKNRRVLSGEWRADPRLDALDGVVMQNKFSESNIVITSIDLSYNGAFRGKYEGREMP